VRLVADSGEQLGIVPVAQALKLAEEQNVDLVEIAPLARPPVCKLKRWPCARAAAKTSGRWP